MLAFKDRLQGRALTGAKNPNKSADPILVHPDVRRMLLEIRSFNEAARALILWTSLQADVSHRSPDAKARQVADEARHVEAYRRLRTDKFRFVYPISKPLQTLIEQALIAAMDD